MVITFIKKCIIKHCDPNEKYVESGKYNIVRGTGKRIFLCFICRPPFSKRDFIDDDNLSEYKVLNLPKLIAKKM